MTIVLLSIRCPTCRRVHLATLQAHHRVPRCPFCGGQLGQRTVDDEQDAA